MVILARINQQLNENLGILKKRMKKYSDISISRYLNPDLVLFMNVSSQEEAIEKLVAGLQEKGVLKDSQLFKDAVCTREKLVSTGIGMGIAIPHAKLIGYDQFFIAIGVQTGEGIEWNSLDDNPVRVIFMIGGPANRQVEYLKILSCLTIAIKNEALRKKLFQALTVNEVIDLFEGY